ncbi:hypothetical protein A2U01_0037252, partial [Trifolium medium]|nr:hypothetical protein [Trifolium medium]
SSISPLVAPFAFPASLNGDRSYASDGEKMNSDGFLVIGCRGDSPREKYEFVKTPCRGSSPRFYPRKFR